MAVYLVDSWFFIALLDESDNHHRQAVRLARRVTGDRLVTHDAVLTEMLAFVSSARADIQHVLTNDHHFTQTGFNVVDE